MTIKIIANELKIGNYLLYKGKLYLISKNPEHVTYGRAGGFIQLEMKEAKTGIKTYEKLRSTESVEKAEVYKEEFQFLYLSGDIVTLMNMEDFDQREVEASLFGDSLPFLEEGMKVTINIFENDIISCHVPEQVVCMVKYADPVIKGQTATSSYKPAILENEVSVMVPPFVKSGDKIVVRTSDLTYVERFKE